MGTWTLWSIVFIGSLFHSGIVHALTAPFLYVEESDQVIPPKVVASAEEVSRIDCMPDATHSRVVQVDPEECARRSCVYAPSEHPNIPDCFLPNDGTHGFRLEGGEEETELGFRYTLRSRNAAIPGLGTQLDDIIFSVEFRGDNLLRFKFEDANDPNRFQIPLPLNIPETRAANPSYNVEVYQNDPFAFRVIRISTGTIIWDTGVGGLMLYDQFLQIATSLPTPNIYGMGENLHESFKHSVDGSITWPIFARDQPLFFDDFIKHNLYSAHPFYECVEEDGNAHGVLLYNANAMDYTVTESPMLVYRTIGGILDFYIVLGPTPENVVQQYTEMIGRPYMPPYFSLGFQLSRYGFNNTQHMMDAVERTWAYDIPIDIVHADIDHMFKQRIFTIDPDDWADLPDFFREIRSNGMSTIMILDPCVEIDETYDVYTKGNELDVWVKWPSVESMPPEDFAEIGTLDMIGYVWPEWKVVFLDPFHPNAEQYWTDLIVEHIEELPIDALWIDMNEPANFGTNEEMPFNWPEDRFPRWALNCTPSKWDDPPYKTSSILQIDEEDMTRKISDKTLCMQGLQGDGEYLQYDVHNLYGHKQTEISLAAMRQAVGGNRRSLILTRSTFVGTGKYGGRWLGDNVSDWRSLRQSIIGMLEFTLFGLPYIGGDICGFFNDCPAELCMRWMQLGAFYPFARNHQHEDPHDQDPGWYGDIVAIPSRVALNTRYLMLPYLYTLFHHAHLEGDTVVRSLVHEFPNDPNTYDVDYQFLWGASLLISPILFEGARSIDVYFPEGIWYDYYNGDALVSSGQYETIENIVWATPIPLHLRGGYIIPTQQPANNTNFSRHNPFGVIVALDSEGFASGNLFWDDGNSIDTYENGNYFYAEFRAVNDVIFIDIINNGIPEIMADLELDTIDIYGLPSVETVLVDGREHRMFGHKEQSKILQLRDLHMPVTKSFTVSWK